MQSVNRATRQYKDIRPDGITRAVLAWVWFAFVYLSMQGAAAAQEATAELSLVQAIEMAVERNPGYRSVITGIDVARFDLEAAAAQRYPRLDLSSGYLYSPLEDRRLIPGALLSDLPVLEDKFDSQIASGGLSLTLPVYTGGRIGSEIGVATESVRAAEAQSERALDDLTFTVTAAFYQVLVLEQIQEAVRASLQSLEESRRVVAQFVAAERAPQLDLLRLDSRLAAVRQALIRTTSEVERARAELRRLIGYSEDGSRLRLQGELAYQALAPADLQQLLQQALAGRPDYEALSARVRAQEHRIQAARAENLPQISLQAGYHAASGLNRARQGDDVQDIGSVALTFSWKLFDGGVIGARVDRERSRYIQFQQALDDLRLAIEFEVRAAWEDVREAAERVANTEVALAAAREALRIEQLRVETGTGIVNDVLDAQAESLQAEVEYETALADHRVARAELARAIGQAP